MFRATILTVVLVFAAGPSASLFCKAWCDPQVAAENGCHHDDIGGSASLSSSDSCQDSVQGLAVLLKEDVRRSSLADSGLTLPVAKFQLVPSPRIPGVVWSRGRAPADLLRPLTTPLRV
ncbi:MAG: hypothetical protein AB7P99_13595 [Vicinamibacterales bacterium]